MTELTPRDFEKMLDADGNICSDEISEDQKKILALADMIKHKSGASAGVKCIFCNGTGWQKNTPWECIHCKGTGGH